jgi:hypothetical protein
MTNYKKILPYPQLLFLIPPLFVYIMANILFELSVDPLQPFINKLIELEKYRMIFNLNNSLIELKARYIWLAAAFLNIVIPIATIIISTLLIIYYLKGKKLIWTFAIGMIFCFSSLAALTYSAHAKTALFELVFGFTYNNLYQSNHYSQDFLSNIKKIIMVINFLAAITPVFLLLAGCAILALPAIPYIIHDPNDIILRMHKLKDLVNVGSVFLVFGILHMNMWLNWAAGLFGDSKLSNYVSGVAWSISTYWGVTFTLLLAVTYLPASAYLQIKAREQISRGELAKETREVEEWLKENGLSFTFSNQIIQFIAIMSPFLATPIGNILKLP